MVDSIDKIGTQKIDWYKLTVREVRNYQSEGADDEIPPEVKKWVEEMAKVANAPDNITYEMSKSGASTAVKPDNNVEGTTGNTLADQGIALGEQSDLAADQVETLMAEIDDWTANAVNAHSQAQEAYDSAMARINALQRELANHTANGDKAKAAATQEQLKAAGEGAQNIIGGFAGQISAVRGNVDGLMSTAQGAINLGSQAVEIGNAVLDEGNSAGINVGKIIEQGTNAIDTGSTGLAGTSSIDGEVNTFGQNVRSYAVDIQQATGASVTIQGAENAKTDETEKEQPPENEEVKEENPQTQKDVEEETNKDTLADDALTTDPLEILKRKQKRGEA